MVARALSLALTGSALRQEEGKALPLDPYASTPLDLRFEASGLPSDPALILHRRCRIRPDRGGGYYTGVVKAAGICEEGIFLEVELNHPREIDFTNPSGRMYLRGSTTRQLRIVTRVEKPYSDTLIDHFEPASIDLL